MQRYINSVITRGGAAVQAASVLVKTLAGATATIYSDDGVTQTTNPLTTDADGRFAFYAADGRYSLTISKTGVITQTTISDILLADPDDGTAEQSAADVIFVQSGSGLVGTTINAAIEELATTGASGAMMRLTGTNSFLLNPTDNTIESTLTSAVNLAAGAVGSGTHIGKLNGLPTGTDLNPGWSADAGYVNGGATFASILGGYDSITNSIASGIVAANHCLISYGIGGHHLIAGGSYNWIDGSNAERCTILGARQSSIQGGPWALIAACDNCDITSAGAHNTIINSLNCTLSGTQSYGVILGGRNHVLSGLGAVILSGATNTNAKQASVVMGEDAIALVGNGLHIGRAALAVASDAQSISTVMAVRTTDATLTNMSDSTSGFLELNGSNTTTGTGSIWLVGMNEADGTQVVYKTDFGFMWNGTNGFLFKSGTQTTVTNSPTLDLDLISQTNNDFTPGAAPHLAINTGALRPKVTGVAATSIKWVAKIDLVMTTMPN